MHTRLEARAAEGLQVSAANGNEGRRGRRRGVVDPRLARTDWGASARWPAFGLYSNCPNTTTVRRRRQPSAYPVPGRVKPPPACHSPPTLSLTVTLSLLSHGERPHTRS